MYTPLLLRWHIRVVFCVFTWEGKKKELDDSDTELLEGLHLSINSKHSELV